MKKSIYFLPAIFALCILAGCKNSNVVLPDWYIICTEDQKNAEVCTLEYMPVCWDDWVTYWNSCSACASETVSSYRDWECNMQCGDESDTCNLENMTDNVDDENINDEKNTEIPETIIEVPTPDF